MVEEGAFSHTIDYDVIFEENLSLKEHLNRFIGLKVAAILVNRGTLPTGLVALGRVCPAACAAGLLH